LSCHYFREYLILYRHLKKLKSYTRFKFSVEKIEKI